MRRDAVCRNRDIAVAEKFKRGRDEIIGVAVDGGVSPDKAVGIGRRELVSKCREPRHYLERCASRGDGVCIKWRCPDLAVGNDLDACQMVRAPGEHKVVFKVQPKRVFPRAANVPVRGFAFCESCLWLNKIHYIGKITIHQQSCQQETVPLLCHRRHHLRWKIVDAVRLVAADEDAD